MFRDDELAEWLGSYYERDIMVFSQKRELKMKWWIIAIVAAILLAGSGGFFVGGCNAKVGSDTADSVATDQAAEISAATQNAAATLATLAKSAFSNTVARSAAGVSVSISSDDIGAVGVANERLRVEKELAEAKLLLLQAQQEKLRRDWALDAERARNVAITGGSGTDAAVHHRPANETRPPTPIGYEWYETTRGKFSLRPITK